MSRQHTITIHSQACANGETREFWLAVDGRRVGKPMFVTPRPSETTAELIVRAFRQLIVRP